jgi:hypothetical protein
VDPKNGFQQPYFLWCLTNDEDSFNKSCLTDKVSDEKWKNRHSVKSARHVVSRSNAILIAADPAVEWRPPSRRATRIKREKPVANAVHLNSHAISHNWTR